MKFNLFEGTWQKVLVKLGIILLVLFVIYKIFKMIQAKIMSNKSAEELANAIEEQINNADPVDNSTNNSTDTISDSEANVIADSLYSAMNGWGTDFELMTGQLQCLNGSSLQKIYSSFGYKDGMNLFSWFNDELSGNAFSSLVYYHDCVPQCDQWSDSCYQTDYMRGIWERSGLNITF